jgi:large subunit ribosomal protein L1
MTHMAKKQAKAESDEAKASPKASEEVKEAKKGKEPKVKEPKVKDEKPKDEKGPKGKESKGKEGKEKEAKGKPTAPAESPGPVGEAASPPTTAVAAVPSAPAEPTKKRGKAPGVPPPRGKKLRTHLLNIKQSLAKEGPAPLSRAIALLKEFKRSKFDETVEIHMALGIDTSQSDQLVRGSVPLPHGIGKSVRLAVFCQGDNVAKAKDAGADHVGSDELIKKIQGGWLDFDVALATQDMMGQVSRLGKTLGPRGLMPTPKAGTVITGDIASAVKEFKTGKVEYRADKGGNIHAGVGKLSFDESKLQENVTAFVEQVRAAKPTGVKGNYVKSITLSATMSPGVAVSM